MLKHVLGLLDFLLLLLPCSEVMLPSLEPSSLTSLESGSAYMLTEFALLEGEGGPEAEPSITIPREGRFLFAVPSAPLALSSNAALELSSLPKGFSMPTKLEGKLGVHRANPPANPPPAALPSLTFVVAVVAIVVIKVVLKCHRHSSNRHNIRKQIAGNEEGDENRSLGGSKLGSWVRLGARVGCEKLRRSEIDGVRAAWKLDANLVHQMRSNEMVVTGVGVTGEGGPDPTQPCAASGDGGCVLLFVSYD